MKRISNNNFNSDDVLVDVDKQPVSEVIDTDVVLLPGTDLLSRTDMGAAGYDTSWNDRMFEFAWDTVVSPTTLTQLTNVSVVHKIFTSTPILRQMASNYSFVRYDHMTVFIVSVGSKEAYGTAMMCLLPVETNRVEAAADTTIPVLYTTYSCLPHSALVSFSDGCDIKFRVPWTYKFKSLRCANLITAASPENVNGHVQLRGCVDSMVTTTGRVTRVPFKVFVSFEGLKFYGPGVVTSQMFSSRQREGLAATGRVLVTGGTLLSAAATGLYTAWSSPKEEAVGMAHPEPVLLSPFGDTTNTSVKKIPPLMLPHPPTLPDTAEELPGDLLTFLSRPQLIGIYNTASIQATVKLPITPVPHDSLNLNHAGTWFSFFGKFAHYWTGSLKFQLFFNAHPFTEYRVRTYIQYKDSNNDGVGLFGINDSSVIVTGGDTCIDVVCPFITRRDRLRINQTWSTPTHDYKIGDLVVVVDSINSASASSTDVKMFVFLSAGPDFMYHAPCSYTPNVIVNIVPSALTSQCHVPGANYSHAVEGAPVHTFGDVMPFRTLQDIMDCWCICLMGAPDGLTSLRNVLNGNFTTGLGMGYKNDNIAWMSSLCLYWSGCIDYKLEFVDSTNIGYVMYQSAAEFYLGDVDGAYPYNLANGGSITDVTQQRVMHVSVPMRSIYRIDDCYNGGQSGQSTPVSNFIHETDLMYRRAGPQFKLYVETGLPPRSVWLQNGEI